MATMTGIDSNHDVTARSIRLGGPFHGRYAARRLEINDETIAVRRIRSGRERPGADGGIEIEDDAKLAIGTDRTADRPNRAGAAWHISEMAAQPAVFQIDNEPVRATQRENTVDDGIAQIQDNACFVIFCPYADVFNGRARDRDRSQQ
jgi:hypothetical protein